MTGFRYLASDENATDRLGQLLADTIPAGTTIALVGTLGAGKTRLVQAVAAALGVPRDGVTSPTFVLVNEYLSGRMPVYHFDTYRLRDDDEFLQLGPDEYFDGNGITFVEWADRVEDCLPIDFLRIHIDVTGETSREFIVSASTAALQTIVEQLSAQESTR